MRVTSHSSTFIAAAFFLISLTVRGDEKPLSLAEATAKFAKVDQELNREYTAAKKTLPDHEFNELRDQQRDWLEYRDNRTKMFMAFDHRDVPEGQEKESAAYWEMMIDLTETRILILKAWQIQNDPELWSGRYTDGYGGYMEIFQEGKILYFTIEVVRGPTYHLGSIGGIAVTNQTSARFTDLEQRKKDNDDEETWLTFDKELRHLKVSGVNTGHYHGARAYFDGKYMRIDTLSEEEAAKLKKSATTPNWSPQEE